jgi:hypothetical protein
MEAKKEPEQMLTEVLKWLDESGFALEMHTASAFRTAGFEVRQSMVYATDDGKPREIDVVAADPEPLGILGIEYVVECKSTKKPWVLLASPDTLASFNRVTAFAGMSKETGGAVIDRIRETGLLPSIMEKEGLVGYSLREAFSKSDSADIPYAAARAVAAACNQFIRRNTPPRNTYYFGFPVIVIAGPLIQASLSEKGEIELVEVDHGEFLFSDLDFATCIRVVTARHLAVFAKEAMQVAKQIRDLLKPETEKILEFWKNRKRT